MTKQYRILEKIYNSGTRYEVNCFHPQVTTGQEEWKNMYEGQVLQLFFDKEEALEYIALKKKPEIEVVEIIHNVE